jgi:hypothetical protein
MLWQRGLDIPLDRTWALDKKLFKSIKNYLVIFGTNLKFSEKSIYTVKKPQSWLFQEEKSTILLKSEQICSKVNNSAQVNKSAKVLGF